jgi:hypothetical protein
MRKRSCDFFSKTTSYGKNVTLERQRNVDLYHRYGVTRAFVCTDEATSLIFLMFYYYKNNVFNYKTTFCPP